MMGRKRYPLVLMLEPLFRCNLACVGLRQDRLPRCDPQSPHVGAGMLGRGRRSGAPMVAIPAASR